GDGAAERGRSPGWRRAGYAGVDRGAELLRARDPADDGAWGAQDGDAHLAGALRWSPDRSQVGSAARRAHCRGACRLARPRRCRSRDLASGRDRLTVGGAPPQAVIAGANRQLADVAAAAHWGSRSWP